jgi:hypothetical protein
LTLITTRTTDSISRKNTKDEKADMFPPGVVGLPFGLGFLISPFAGPVDRRVEGKGWFGPPLSVLPANISRKIAIICLAKPLTWFHPNAPAG